MKSPFASSVTVPRRFISDFQSFVSNARSDTDGQPTRTTFGCARSLYAHSHLHSCSLWPGAASMHSPAQPSSPCCSWGRREGGTTTVFALPLHLPCPPSASKQRNPFRCVAPRCWEAISIDPCPFPPTPHRKVARCALGMMLRRLSPLVNVFFPPR